jgi:UDP-N-acetylglucosamine 2-epimerase (non-hydrolysing)
MTSTQLTFVLGTRPEIIKLAPLIRLCDRREVPYTVIHTGQHYSESLDSVFFEKLALPSPDHNLQVGSKPHGAQTGEMIAGIEEILREERPDTVLVQGDTNSVLAGAIAADKLETELGHVEAGLRSFDREMPEESNRRVADHLADYLFAPSETAADLLRQEGIDEDRISVTGNTVVDAVERHQSVAEEKSSALADLGLTPGEFVLMTAHRAENVDNPRRFRRILRGVSLVAREFDLPVVYPIHPRAEAKLEEFDLTVPDEVRTVDPLDYLDFLTLQANARLILTDSGGIQEEASILQVPCVTMREHTERPETVSVGANELCGTTPGEILRAARGMDRTSTNWDTPYGDGDAAEKILSVVTDAEPSQEVPQ